MPKQTPAGSVLKVAGDVPEGIEAQAAADPPSREGRSVANPRAKGRPSSGAPVRDLLAVLAVGPGRVSADYTSTSGLLSVLSVPLGPVFRISQGGGRCSGACARICAKPHRNGSVGTGAECTIVEDFRRSPALADVRLCLCKAEVIGSIPIRSMKLNDGCS